MKDTCMGCRNHLHLLYLGETVGLWGRLFLMVITMCDKSAYREQGYKPRDGEQLWNESAMNPKNKKKGDEKDGRSNSMS